MTVGQKNISFFEKKDQITGKLFYFLGMRHTNDQKDPEFAELQKFWIDFLNFSKHSQIVFSEGRVLPILNKTLEESIQSRGEVGAIQWLANNAKVQCISPEPSDKEQREFLCSHFDRQLVVYAFIVQNLAAWYKHSWQSSFQEGMQRTIDREAKFFDIYKFTPDILWFNNKHTELFGEQKVEDKQFLESISDPRISNTIVNKIIASKSQMRNGYILTSIKEAWNGNKDIFIVYGRGHLDALKDELGKIII